MRLDNFFKHRKTLQDIIIVLTFFQISYLI
jgi:hypothetical protein